MSAVVTRPEDPGPMPALSMQEIGALKQGLEEAIAEVLRGTATAVVILAPRKDGAKAWHAGPTGAVDAGHCQLALVTKAPLDDEPPEAA